MRKNKKLILAAAAVALLAIVMVVIFALTRPQAVQGAKTFTVEVVHSDHTDAEYLGEVLLAEGLIAGEDGQFGLYITTVDGEPAVYEEDGAYWALYEGEDYAQQGVDKTPVLDGGAFSLVYTVG